MDNQIKDEHYSLTYPKDIFRFFSKAIYSEIKMSNEEIDSIGEMFYEYLRGLNLTEKQRTNILPKDILDVLVNSTHPFRTNGFPPAYIIHFNNYVEIQKNKILNNKY